MRGRATRRGRAAVAGLALAVVGALAACGSERGVRPQPMPALASLQLRKVAGDSQAVAGGGRSDTMVVQVLDSSGRAIPGAPLYWRRWFGTLALADTISDARGRARAVWAAECTENPVLVEVGVAVEDGAKAWFQLVPVPGAVAQIQLDGLKGDLAPAETALVVLRSTDACGWTVAPGSVRWSVADSSVIRIAASSATGATLVARSTGATTVHATAAAFADGAAGGVQVRAPAGPLHALAVAAGFGCALDAAGDVRCWGPATGPIEGDSTLLYAHAVTTGRDFRTLAAADEATCALDATGQAWCWGRNATGQVGDGTTEPRSAPVAIGGPVRFAAIAAGVTHSCALDTEGAAYCWGANEVGQLGDGTRTARLVPTRVSSTLRFSAIAAGRGYSCAVAQDGTPWCWGREGALNYYEEPPTHLVPERLAGTPPLRATALGAENGCGLTLNGEAWCWGGRVIDPGQPLGYSGAPQRVPAAVPFTALTMGFVHACALDAGGATYCWGGNRAAQLGRMDVESRSRPEPVAAPRMRALASGPSAWSTCGETTGGEVYCWGILSGALGRMRPVREWCWWGNGVPSYYCAPVPRAVLER